MESPTCDYEKKTKTEKGHFKTLAPSGQCNDLHHQKAHEKLNIRQLNGHLDFSSGFQVIDASIYEKMLKSRKNPEH